MATLPQSDPRRQQLAGTPDIAVSPKRPDVVTAVRTVRHPGGLAESLPE